MDQKQYDAIIIGGGATGSGIALDLASRGFKTLLLEKNDFGEGTSSRSTKLVHGGVRYLEKAVKQLDKEQYNLVKEGLSERARVLRNAPHLADRLTLVTPIYRWWELPYMFAGLTMYDLVSGDQGLGRSSIVSRQKMIETYPVIKKEGLVGGVKYYDGRFNDARMVIAILQTAQKYGAVCRNYHEVTGFCYDETGKINGVSVNDKLTGSTYDAHATVVINAAGPFADTVRYIDDPKAPKMLNISSGIHIVLDKKYLPSDEGLMIPKTEDGRVLFILPWMDKCLVGTTDEGCALEDHPKVEDKDIDYIIKHLDLYFDMKITKDDILSTWSGLRPLVCPSDDDNTQNIVRDHLIFQSNSGLVTMIGGKWTTYRKMGEDMGEYLIEHFNLPNIPCRTKEMKLVGSETFSEEYTLDGVDEEIAKHLHVLYGDKAQAVCDSVENIEKLHPDYHFTNAEVIYTTKHEFVQKPIDFLVRRSILALIDLEAAKAILDQVVSLMQETLGWDDDKASHEKEASLYILENAL